MRSSLRRTARRVANLALGAIDLELVRRERTFQEYIPLKETLLGARRSGMSVGDYIDYKHNVPNATQETIDQMAALGVFDCRIDRVCEIGPGSGRYLEKTMSVCSPAEYEVYETAIPWRQWLVRTYGVTGHLADGHSLSRTGSGTVDLVHTHKMLYGLPVIKVFRYYSEMARIVRNGGKIVFDNLTEDCLREPELEAWISSGVQHACTMIAKQSAIDFFAARDCQLDGTFFVTLKPGITQYFVFTKGN